MSQLLLSPRVELNYQLEGDGDVTFLLFNGNSLSLEFWGSFADKLATRARVNPCRDRLVLLSSGRLKRTSESLISAVILEGTDVDSSPLGPFTPSTSPVSFTVTPLGIAIAALPRIQYAMFPATG